MKLDDFTFLELPQAMTMIRAERESAVVKTYDSVAFFSWGADIVGKAITLTWNAMTKTQFDLLDEIYQADVEVEFDPTDITEESTKYNVQVTNLQGEYWAGVSDYRLNCSLELLIMSEVT